MFEGFASSAVAPVTIVARNYFKPSNVCFLQPFKTVCLIYSHLSCKVAIICHKVVCFSNEFYYSSRNKEKRVLMAYPDIKGIDRRICTVCWWHSLFSYWINGYCRIYWQIEKALSRLCEMHRESYSIILLISNNDSVFSCCNQNTMYRNNFRHITKTRLFKYIENFTFKNWKFSDKKLWYFSYFCSKHRLWVHVRTASARRF